MFGCFVLRTIKQVIAQDRDRINPGVYFDLDEKKYHADPALGSTDIRLLRNAPYDWYWHRIHNQHVTRHGDDDDEGSWISFDDMSDDDRQVIRKNDGREVGTAIHLFVLAGRSEFERRYMRRPVHVKKINDDRARMIAPDGEKILHPEDYDRAVIASAAILASPKISGAFRGGFPEVSVFWIGEFEGRRIPFKARFDFLKPAATVDLKSIRNSQERPFVDACLHRIADKRYDIQAEHYCEGRRQMRALVSAGEVHGCPDHGLLGRIAEPEQTVFAFVFFQTNGAPLTLARKISPANPMLVTARDDIDAALAQYVTIAERFGFDTPWLLEEEVEELHAEDLPPWYRR